MFADSLGIEKIEKGRLMRWDRHEPEIQFLWVEDQIAK